MTTEHNIERLKRIIRALLAKASDPAVTKAESDAYFERAYEMMHKYQLEEAELGHDDPIGHTEGVLGQSGPQAYKTKVQHALAYFYGAQTVRNWVGQKFRIELYGPESARVTTVIMTDFVWGELERHAGELSRATLRNKAACLREMANALIIRVWREIRKRQATEVGQPASPKALAVVDQTRALILKHFPDLRPGGKGRGIKTTKGATERAAGISLSRQVGGAGTLRLK